MVPFIVIEVENATVTDTTVVGDTQIVPIVVDWDLVDGDSDSAQDLIDEIRDCYPDYHSLAVGNARKIVDRLQGIVDDNPDEDEDDYEDDEDEDDEDDKQDEDYAPGDFTADQKPEYNGNELIGGEPTPLDPRD